MTIIKRIVMVFHLRLHIRSTEDDCAQYLCQDKFGSIY